MWLPILYLCVIAPVCGIVGFHAIRLTLHPTAEQTREDD